MTWKTLVFLNDSGWKQTVVACAKYWSDPGKGWPAAGCSKVEAVCGWNCALTRLHRFPSYLWVENQRPAFFRESRNRATLLLFAVLCPELFPMYLLPHQLPDNKCVAYSNFFVPVEKNTHVWRVSFSDAYCTGCFTHRYEHCAELWGILIFVQRLLRQSTSSAQRGCQTSHHKDTVTKTLTGESCSFTNGEWVFFCLVVSLEHHASLSHLSLCGFAQNEWLWLLHRLCGCRSIFNLSVEVSPVQSCCRSSGPA